MTAAVGSLFDFSLDTGHHIDGWVPFNLMSACFALIVFGALGRFLEHYMINLLSAVIVMVPMLLLSFVAYVLLYNCVIAKLKSSNPAAITWYEVVGAVGKLTLRVTPDSDGIVSVPDSTGANISYNARACDFYKFDVTGRIEPGTEVAITGFDKDANVYYVHPLYQ